MKKYALLYTLIFGLMILNINGSIALSQCCMINNSKCTFWDMGIWTAAEDFCTKLDMGINVKTTYFNQSCPSVAPSMPGCTDGFIACGDGKCESPERCDVCIADCGSCPAPAYSGSGGGGGGGGGGSCTPEWTCSDWSACANGIQTRTCTNSKSYCNINHPIETQGCTMPVTTEQTTQTETETEETGIESTAPITGAATAPANTGITGAFIGAIKTPAGIAITFIVVVALIGAAFPLRNYIKARKGKK